MGLGWGILDFSKPVGQGGFGAYSEAKLVSQFMPTKFLCHKMSQNSTVFSVSYSRDCKLNLSFYCSRVIHLALKAEGFPNDISKSTSSLQMDKLP